MIEVDTPIECPRCGNHRFERVCEVTTWAPLSLEIMSDGSKVHYIDYDKEEQEVTGDSYFQCTTRKCTWRVPDELVNEYESQN